MERLGAPDDEAARTTTEYGPQRSCRTTSICSASLAAFQALVVHTSFIFLPHHTSPSTDMALTCVLAVAASGSRSKSRCSAGAPARCIAMTRRKKRRSVTSNGMQNPQRARRRRQGVMRVIRRHEHQRPRIWRDRSLWPAGTVMPGSGRSDVKALRDSPGPRLPPGAMLRNRRRSTSPADAGAAGYSTGPKEFSAQAPISNTFGLQRKTGCAMPSIFREVIVNLFPDGLKEKIDVRIDQTVDVHHAIHLADGLVLLGPGLFHGIAPEELRQRIREIEPKLGIPVGLSATVAAVPSAASIPPPRPRGSEPPRSSRPSVR